MIKKFLRSVPGGARLLDLIRERRFYKRAAGARTHKELFTRFYERNRWGSKESASGPGSTAEYTANIRAEIPKLIEQLGVSRLLDAPCGDYNWFQHIPRGEDVAYVGGDIVAPLIRSNRSRFGSPSTSFVELDITRDPLPAADLWICRDVLFHFSYHHIFSTLRNFVASDIRYLLTTCHPNCPENKDIPTGAFRLLNLELPPFNFCPPLLRIDDWIEGAHVRQLCLWEKQALESWLVANKTLKRRATANR